MAISASFQPSAPTRGQSLKAADTPVVASRRRLRPFAEIAEALKRQANQLGESAIHMEVTAAAIGLSEAAAARCRFETQEQADLLADARRIIESLRCSEDFVRQLNGETV